MFSFLSKFGFLGLRREHARLNSLRRVNETRMVEENQLDEGIGDTLVSLGPMSTHNFHFRQRVGWATAHLLFGDKVAMVWCPAPPNSFPQEIPKHPDHDSGHPRSVIGLAQNGARFHVGTVIGISPEC